MSDWKIGDRAFVVALRNAWPAISAALKAARALMECEGDDAPGVVSVLVSDRERLRAALGKLAP